MSEGRALSARKDIRGRTPEVGDFIAVGGRAGSHGFFGVRMVTRAEPDGRVFSSKGPGGRSSRTHSNFLILPMEYGDVWGKTS